MQQPSERTAQLPREEDTVCASQYNPPWFIKAPSSNECNLRLRGSSAAALSAPSTIFPFSYGGMAQGPFLMSTPRGSGRTMNSLSVAAPSWYSPMVNYHHANTRSVSRGPNNGVATHPRADDDSFYGTVINDTVNPSAGAAQAEPPLSSASPVIFRSRASSLIVQSSSSVGPTVNGVASAFLRSVAPAVTSVSTVAKSAEYAVGAGARDGAYHTQSASTASIYPTGTVTPLIRATGMSTYGYGVRTLYQHHRSATANSIGSTGTSISKCHLSRKEDHLDPMKLGQGGSRERRGRHNSHGGAGGIYSVSTLGTASTSFVEDRSPSAVSTHNQSNSFYQPFQERPCSQNCSLGSLVVDALDASPLVRQDGSHYSTHSYHGARDCSASRSITYDEGDYTSLSFLMRDAHVPTALNEEESDASSTVRDRTSPRTPNDNDEERYRSISPSHVTHSLFDEENPPRSASVDVLSPLETNEEGVAFPLAAVTHAKLVVTPPSGEQRNIFVRRHLVALAAGPHTAAPAHTPHAAAATATASTTAPAPSARATHIFSRSCPERLSDDYIERRQNDADGVVCAATTTSPSRSAARSSPISLRSSGAATETESGGDSLPGFDVGNSFDTRVAQKKRSARAERSASF